MLIDLSAFRTCKTLVPTYKNDNNRGNIKVIQAEVQIEGIEKIST